MKAPRRKFALPIFKINFREALAAMSLFALIVNGTLGSLPAYAFLGCFSLFTVLYFGHLIHALRSYWYFLVYPLLCLASTFWADDPPTTLRHTLQLLTTFIAAIYISRTLSPAAFIKLIFAASAFLLILSLPAVPAALHAKWPLTGIFASKNSMGFGSHVAWTSSLCIIFYSRNSSLYKAVAIIIAPISIFTLFLSQAAGAELYTVISTLTIIISALYMFMPKRFKPLFLFGAGFLINLGLAGLPLLASLWKGFQEGALHKDASLTGRTYLWDFGGRLVNERPWFGHGTASFWRQGNIDAEGLWRKFEITGRAGFNFHNLFVEAAVGNGYVGLALLIASLLTVAFGAILGFIINPTREKIFFLSYTAALYVGMGTESALIGPFDSYTIIWVATFVYCARQARITRASAATNALARSPTWRRYHPWTPKQPSLLHAPAPPSVNL